MSLSHSDTEDTEKKVISSDWATGGETVHAWKNRWRYPAASGTYR
jgi:hypothetical protein